MYIKAHLFPIATAHQPWPNSLLLLFSPSPWRPHRVFPQSQRRHRNLPNWPWVPDLRMVTTGLCFLTGSPKMGMYGHPTLSTYTHEQEDAPPAKPFWNATALMLCKTTLARLPAERGILHMTARLGLKPAMWTSTMWFHWLMHGRYNLFLLLYSYACWWKEVWRIWMDY